MSNPSDPAISLFLIIALVLLAIYVLLRGYFSSHQRMQRALNLLNQSKYEEAAGVWQTVLTKSKGRPESLVIITSTMIGKCFQSLHRRDEAMRAYRRAIETSADQDYLVFRLWALGGMAGLQWETGEPAQSMETFRQALLLSNADNLRRHRPNLLHNYSLLLKGLGQTRKAADCLREAAEIAAETSTPDLQCHIFSTLSFTLCSLGDLTEAEIACKKARDRASISGRSFDFKSALNTEAGIEWTRGNRDNAERLIESALALTGKDDDVMTAMVLLKKAAFACETREFDQALETLTQAEQFIPAMSIQNQTDLFRFRAFALAKLGKTAEALQLLNRCEVFPIARRIPNESACLDETAAIVAMSGQKYDEAISHLEHALEFSERAELRRDTALICRHLGIAFHAVGKTTQGHEFIERARRIFLEFGDVTSAAELPS